VLPAVLGAGSAAYLAVPIFPVIAGTFFADAALGYSLNQSTKEVLYTPTDEATKYQAKAFIDMFLMRLAKGLSSLLILASMATWVAGETVHLLALLSVVVVVAWLAVAVAAGRAFARQVEGADATTPARGKTARPRGPLRARLSRARG
jgi:AAA family ATP:ADP antiporter